MAFVLDCSMTMAWVIPDEATAATDRLRDALLETRAFVPALRLIETANVLLVATRRGRIAQDEWPGLLAHLDALSIDICPHLPAIHISHVGRDTRPGENSRNLRLRRHVPGTRHAGCGCRSPRWAARLGSVDDHAHDYAGMTFVERLSVLVKPDPLVGVQR